MILKIKSLSEKKFKNLNYDNLGKLNLHTLKISEYSAIIARKKQQRNFEKFQQSFQKNKNCCIEGRDISTKILPNSDLKFFFKCDLNIAANRRYKELKKANSNINLVKVKKALRIRNILDTKRKNSPLLKHRDLEIDTGKLDKQAVLAKMSKHVKILLKKIWQQNKNLNNNPLQKEFQNLLDQDFKSRKLKENEIIKATVTEITKNFIVVDCKAKMKG